MCKQQNKMQIKQFLLIPRLQTFNIEGNVNPLCVTDLF